MKVRFVIYTVLALLVFSACEKNSFPKLPSIALIYFGPDSVLANIDTPLIEFHLTSGAANLGNDPNSTTVPKKYDIYIKDFRYDTGFVGYYFPAIDQSIENSKVGIEGTCLFEFIGAAAITPRTDSLHMATGDTTHFELYIMDRAGDTSNHITTAPIIVRP